MRLTTTLNRIRACAPCTEGWRKLIKHLGDNFDPDTEINLLTILESNNVADMLWTLRATVQDSRSIASQLTIEFAEQVLPIFEQRQLDDLRPRRAIQAARDFLEKKISLKELWVAKTAAYDAAYAYNADVAADVAAAYNAAAYAAYVAYAYDAAAYYDAAYADAYAADAYAAYAYDVAAYAAYAAYAADAAADAAYDTAARVEAREKQAEIIRSILE